MQEEERVWSRFMLLSCLFNFVRVCECLNNIKQSSDLWSGCVFPPWCFFRARVGNNLYFLAINDKAAFPSDFEQASQRSWQVWSPHFHSDTEFCWIVSSRGKSSKCEYSINTCKNCDGISKPQKSGGSQTLLLLALFSVIDVNVLSSSLPSCSLPKSCWKESQEWSRSL